MKSPLHYLFPVILLSHSRLVHTIYMKVRSFHPDTPAAFTIMMDELIRQHINETRKELYKVIRSKSFKKVFRVAGDILKLNMSDFKKAAFILIILDVSFEDVCHIMISNKESMMTTRSSLKRSHPEYFHDVSASVKNLR